VIRDDLIDALTDAATSLGLEPPAAVALEVPRQREHGDWSSNLALQVAKSSGRSPREVAGELAEVLRNAGLPHVAAIEVAGPGFVNFTLAPTWLHDVVRDIAAASDARSSANWLPVSLR